MTPPNDKETLEQKHEGQPVQNCSGAGRVKNESSRVVHVNQETLEQRINTLRHKQIWSAIEEVDAMEIIDTLTTQLADRDALIVRQEEMLERARDEVCNIEFELDCALNLPGSSPSNLAKAARLSLQTATDLITALQPTAAKDAGDGEIG